MHLPSGYRTFGPRLNAGEKHGLCSRPAASKRLSIVMAAHVKVVGMGSCCLDYLASLAAFPKPDEKLRTETFEVQGGGNCGNALTAVARLGLSPVIVSKVGNDGLGDRILAELQGDGVDTRHVLREKNQPSPFTYIIVDRSGGTRTCIHTPGAPFQPEELRASRIDAILQDAKLVYFDGRLTEAALKLARAAGEKKIPVLVEAERLRPGLEALLAQADYVVTSAHFPQDWTGEADLGDALLSAAVRLPRAKFLITTLGSRGSIMLERPPPQVQQADVPSHTLSSIMDELTARLKVINDVDTPEGTQAAQGDVKGDTRIYSFPSVSSRDEFPRPTSPYTVFPSPSVGCKSVTGVVVEGGAVESTGLIKLHYTAGRDDAARFGKMEEAAQKEAERNAQSGQGAVYLSSQLQADTAQGPVIARVVMASAAGLPQDSVVDTTGAGDAFIGSVMYGVCTGMSRKRMLQLASVVAACKCTALGARQGLPHREKISAELLGGEL